MRYFLLSLLFCCLIITSKSFAQNYNYIAHSTFEGNFIYDYNQDVYDTNFNNSLTCWVSANKTGGAMGYTMDNFAQTFNPNTHLGSGDTSIHIPKTNCLTFQTFTPLFLISQNTFIDTLDVNSNSRMYSQTKLLFPLIANKTYYFSMKVYGIKQSTYGFNAYFDNTIANIGTYFSQNQVSDYNNKYRINVIPQINFTNWTFPKVDTFTWTTLKGTFIAQGGEQYMTLGNFDYFKNFTMAAFNSRQVPPNYQNDTINSLLSLLNIDDLILVSDTTQPIIALDQFSLGNDTTVCEGTTLTLGGEPNFFHYWWNTGDTTRFINVNQAGKYWCTVDYGCNTYTDTIQVKMDTKPVPFTIGNDTLICSNQQIILTAPPHYNYTWSNGDTNRSIIITQAGSYNCTIKNTCGSMTSNNITIGIKETPFPQTIILGDSDLCKNGEMNPITLFTNSTNQLLWSTGSIQKNIIVEKPNWYWLKEYNECGENTDSVYVDGCIGIVAFPTVFSPNGDGLNDEFKPIIQDIGKVNGYTLNVYNRAGNMVFKTTNITKGWTGDRCDIGTYFYLCSYKELGKEFIYLKGDIELVR